MRVLPYGESALLAEVADVRLVPSVRAALAELPGVVDAVAGARTVLVSYVPEAAARVRAVLAAADFTAAAGVDPPALVEIAVVYDGADLDDIAAVTGLDAETVIGLHLSGRYTVRFCGFSPGFAYLDGLDERLHVPRRADPRTSVPSGSVAIAGEFAGVYPRASPGGWQLLGHTDLELWNTGADPPAVLTPGTPVRFVRQ